MANDDRRHPTADDFPDPRTLTAPIGPLVQVRPDAGGAGRELGGWLIFLLFTAVVMAGQGSFETLWGLAREWGLLPLLTALAVLAAGRSAWRHFVSGAEAWRRRLAAATPPLKASKVALSFGAPGVHDTPGLDIALPGAATAPSPFDPADPAHRAAADRIHRLRTLDGLDLTEDERLRVLLPVLDRVVERTREQRLDDWAAVAAWLADRSDRRRAWIGAMALAEDRRSAPATEALALLDDAPWLDALTAAMLADGARPAAIAAAWHTGDGAALDRLIERADAFTEIAVLTEMLDLRAQLPDPPLDRWLADADLGPALVGLVAERLPPADWRRLVDHPQPAVAVRAVDRVLPTSLARSAARALLARADVRAGIAANGQWVPIVQRALRALSIEGDLSDLRRMGAWLGVTAVTGQVRPLMDALRARLDQVPGGGALELVTDESGGGLSVARANGELALS